MSSDQLTSLVTLLLAVGAASACSRGTAVTPEVFGQWEVVGHQGAGVSAMSDSQAAAWTGRDAYFASNVARFHRDSCSRPAYRSQSVPADSLFDIGFRIAPRELGFTSGSNVRITEVSCEGKDWTAPGALIIWADPNRAYTVWDGEFFTLLRK